MAKVSGDAIQNAIGNEIIKRKGMVYLMAKDHQIKREQGQDVTDIANLINENQQIVDVLLDILRAEGDPVYVQNLEAQLETLLNQITINHKPDNTPNQ